MTEAPHSLAMSPDAYVDQLYRLVLRRPVDPQGLRHWTAVIERTRDPTLVLQALLGSEEHRRVMGPDGGAMPPDEFARSVPAMLTNAERVGLTARCRDAEGIPKVADAGLVHVEADGTRVQIMHNGLRVLADGYSGAWMTELISRCHGHHEPQEELAFHQMLARLAPDATMVELGGYWAYYSLWFLQGMPGRRAWVLEPDTANLEVGRRNAALNGLEPAFQQAFAGAVSTPSAPFRTERSGEVLLPCVAVPDLMERHGIDCLDVLHCDTQGAELDVLRSCRTLLRAGHIRTAFVSTHAQAITGDPLTHQRCLAEVEDSGGIVIAEHDVHESFSGDGLIVAQFGPDKHEARPLALSYNRYSHSLFRNPLYDLAQYAV